MSPLIAQSFLNDPLVRQAKEQIFKALRSHQENFRDIRPPQQELTTSYQEAIKELETIRGASMTLPYLASGIGKGPLVELADGSIKYDFIIGIGVHFLGHSHPEMTAAVFDAALSDVIMQGKLQPNIPSL